MRRRLLRALRRRPRVAAAVMLGELLPFGMSWLKRLDQVAARPVEGLEADLYSPATGPRRPGVVLLLGALLEGRAYEPLRGLAEAVARAGYAVLVPELGRLRQLELGPEAVRDAVRAFAVLREQPEVAPGPVGVFGFSAGASIGLLAAARDEARGFVAFVGALGAYLWIEDLLAVALCGRGDGWDALPPERTTVYTVANSVIEQLPEGPDRDILRAALQSAGDPVLDAFDALPADRLGPAAAAVLRLLRNRDPAAIPDLIAGLEPGQRRALAQLSPGACLERIEVPVWVLHDRNDPYIPVQQAERLRADPRAAGFRIYITAALEHVELRRAALSPLGRAWVYLRNLPALLAFAGEPLTALQRTREG